MSRNYICDCCGISLDEFDDDYILHTKYGDESKDYCPYCSKEINDNNLPEKVKKLQDIFSSRPLTISEKLRQEKVVNDHNAYNLDHRKEYTL